VIVRPALRAHRWPRPPARARTQCFTLPQPRDDVGQGSLGPGVHALVVADGRHVRAVGSKATETLRAFKGFDGLGPRQSNLRIPCCAGGPFYGAGKHSRVRVRIA
jgi:hypothetical protein